MNIESTLIIHITTADILIALDIDAPPAAAQNVDVPPAADLGTDTPLATALGVAALEEYSFAKFYLGA